MKCSGIFVGRTLCNNGYGLKKCVLEKITFNHGLFQLQHEVGRDSKVKDKECDLSIAFTVHNCLIKKFFS